MKIKRVFLLILILFSVFLIGDNRILSAETAGQKRFQIVAVEENSSERKILSQTTIEGLAGTDFNVNLLTANYKLHAAFISDFVSDDKLKIKSKFDTRRFYGYSPANLPLYEEDLQNQTLLLGFDESIVLLPFGQGNSENETLKIEITPTLLSDVSKESTDALKINIDKPLPSGEITVEAFTNPHRFKVEATLLADGREIARGISEVSFDEEQEISLLQHADAKNLPANFTAKFTVNKYTRNRPRDFVGIGYRIFQTQRTPRFRAVLASLFSAMNLFIS